MNLRLNAEKASDCDNPFTVRNHQSDHLREYKAVSGSISQPQPKAALAPTPCAIVYPSRTEGALEDGRIIKYAFVHAHMGAARMSAVIQPSCGLTEWSADNGLLNIHHKTMRSNLIKWYAGML